MVCMDGLCLRAVVVHPWYDHSALQQARGLVIGHIWTKYSSAKTIFTNHSLLNLEREYCRPITLAEQGISYAWAHDKKLPNFTDT